MGFALLLGSTFAMVEAVSVATSGIDLFYGTPLPPADRPLPALEWLSAAVLLGVAALRAVNSGGQSGY